MQEAEPGSCARRSSGGNGFSPGAGSLALNDALGLRGSDGIIPSATTSSGLQWDGTERLDALLSVLHAEPSPINRTMVRAWFISAVARAMDPRCKCDTAMVLVGEQGVRKSTFYRVLAGRWFSDTAVDIESGFDDADQRRVDLRARRDRARHRARARAHQAFISSARDTFPRRSSYALGLSAIMRDRGLDERGPVPQRPDRDRFWCIRVGERVDIDALGASAISSGPGRRRVPRAGGVVAHDGGRGCAAQNERGFRVVDPWGRRSRDGSGPPARSTCNARSRRSGSWSTCSAAPVGHRPARREPRRGGDEAPGVGQSPRWIDGRTQRVWNRKDVTPVILTAFAPTHRISTSWDRYRKSNPSEHPIREACMRKVCKNIIKQALTVYRHILLGTVTHQQQAFSLSLDRSGRRNRGDLQARDVRRCRRRYGAPTRSHLGAPLQRPAGRKGRPPPGGPSGRPTPPGADGAVAGGAGWSVTALSSVLGALASPGVRRRGSCRSDPSDGRSRPISPGTARDVRGGPDRRRDAGAVRARCPTDQRGLRVRDGHGDHAARPRDGVRVRGPRADDARAPARAAGRRADGRPRSRWTGRS